MPEKFVKLTKRNHQTNLLTKLTAFCLKKKNDSNNENKVIYIESKTNNYEYHMKNNSQFLKLFDSCLNYDPEKRYTCK